MDSAKELSVGFLRSHPEGAVPVLAALTPEDAADYLKDIPDEVAGRALAIMQPVIAASILPRFARRKAAAVLLTMDVHDRSRIMRVLDDGPMKSIMDQMPKGAARDLAKVLSYPEGSAGAWMSSDVAVFEKATTVGDCLGQLRAMPEKVRNPAFVVDADRKLLGAVELAELLAAADDVGVETIVHGEVKRLSPYARLSSVVALPSWDSALSMPVVDAKKRLLGALHFDRLREGLTAERRSESQGHMALILAHVAEAFLVCVVGILHGSTAKTILFRPVGDLED